MRGWRVLVVAAALVVVAGCPPPQHPSTPDPDDANDPATTDDEPAPTLAPAPVATPPRAPPPPAPAAHPAPVSAAPIAAAPAAKVIDQFSDFAFDGGRIDFELRQVGDRVVETARNRYAVPLVMQWSMSGFVNMMPTAPSDGVIVLPPASKPMGDGKAVELVAFEVLDPHKPPRAEVQFHARFGNPSARPSRYVYALPFGKNESFAVLQGFHGAFSHRGSNEYAIDFDCPVATSVLATRPGIVVAANESAIGSGTTPEYLDFHRVNFVLVLHDDGTLGEYMHLSPSGVIVAPGDRVVRGQPLALSGNTGFSSTPHLHFQVTTAATDGIAEHSFPFELAIGPRRVESPVQGRTYVGWE